MIRLITGGARSGKSTFAESLYKDEDEVVYIATSIVFDEEMEERVALHKESRPKTWRTYEAPYHLEDALASEKYYLLDCITIFISNIMFDLVEDIEYIDADLQAKIEKRVMDRISKLIERIRDSKSSLIMVTNEIGMGIVPDNHLSRVFRDIQGRINQELGKLADEVYLVACGIPVKLK